MGTGKTFYKYQRESLCEYQPGCDEKSQCRFKNGWIWNPLPYHSHPIYCPFTGRYVKYRFRNRETKKPIGNVESIWQKDI